MSADYITGLFAKYMEGTASAKEMEELAEITDQYTNDELADILEPLAIKMEKDPNFIVEDWESVIRAILANPPARKTNIISVQYWYRVAAAAVIVGMLSLGTYFYFHRPAREQAPGSGTLAIKKDVEAPKGTKATITLASGQQVALDSIASGTLAVQGNVNVIKAGDGKIVYKGTAANVTYNTLTNPRGSNVVDMTLADGSRVWLNAGSSVTYPIAFAGNERKVQVTGEAYFEVTHNAAMPFVVQKNDVRVQVLGTHFNVNTYDDEADIKVTLLEGSVKVTRGASIGMLKPGEQAVIHNNGVIKVVKGVDIEEVMAWKNGVFVFRNTNIDAIMRQVARWYDVEIVYKGNFASLNFGGTVSRKANVSELLKLLEATEAVHFSVEGRKITVMH